MSQRDRLSSQTGLGPGGGSCSLGRGLGVLDSQVSRWTSGQLEGLEEAAGLHFSLTCAPPPHLTSTPSPHPMVTQHQALTIS